MPEGRSFPFKYLPRPGVALSVTFGPPILDTDLRTALQINLRQSNTSQDPIGEQESDSTTGQGWLGAGGGSGSEVARVRSAVTAVLHREVEQLGLQVVRAHMKE